MLQKKVFLFGNSILMAGLAANLQDEPEMEIEQVNEPDAIKPANIPTVIFVDLRDSVCIRALPALCALPNVTLLGFDSTASTFNVLTGTSHPASSMQAVLNWLRETI